ncbi:hypothetical protein Drose_22895 [Dactylosporangium roseum]|uniref:TetR family transcriptional regulator n=1 Tax=Dactylosporangium roseum TaxID=47989 RepID=A0ABY5YXH6_9ACTN|nr:hypothetical protein [Dactylosporangium roseum]UWZ34099.1 hypothetical protein Drose_22895 [Dactylosporangium roseum]
MTLTIIKPPQLDNTVVGQWHRRLSGNSSAKRSHWRTKTIYFQAVAKLVETHPGANLTWKSIVDAAAPRGSRSTFYEVAGAHARHPLIDELIRDGRTDSIQLALVYQRNDAVAQLVDETKVWSYWPFRERLLASLTSAPHSPHTMEEALAHSLAAWAKRHPRLAAAQDHTPPICTVEDLMVVMNGRVAAIRAAVLLAERIRRSV